jgi:hypothetical protein
MLDMYRAALFLHILGALGFFVALALEWLATAYLRSATTRDQAVDWLGVRALVQRIGPLSMAVLLVPGLFMAVSRWNLMGWPGAALLGMLGIVVIGLALTGRSTAALTATVATQDAALSPDFVLTLRDARYSYSLAMRVALAVGIVAVMVFKPDLFWSFVLLALALAVGVAIPPAITTILRWAGTADGPRAGIPSPAVER